MVQSFVTDSENCAVIKQKKTGEFSVVTDHFQQFNWSIKMIIQIN